MCAPYSCYSPPQADYATWFGANIEYIHGIQMLPVTPITELLLTKPWVTEEYPVVAPALANPATADGWKGFILADLAVSSCPSPSPIPSPSPSLSPSPKTSPKPTVVYCFSC